MMHLRRLALLLLFMLMATAAPATTLSVGSGAGCSYPTLQGALTLLAGQPGTHTIKLRRETMAIADGVTYSPTVAQTALYLEGGYTECTDAAPAGDGSVLDASGGLARPALRLRIAGNVGTVQIRRVAIQGGDADVTGDAYNGAGGGLAVIGPASVLLGIGTVVRNNHAVRGGGVALVGGLLAGPAPDRVDFYLAEGASITGNEAVEEGGGVYCGGASVPGTPTSGARHASLVITDGIIGYNTAGGLGGAFYCHGTVEGGGGFQPRPAPDKAALIIGNHTTASGGCAAGSGTLDAGTPVGFGGYRRLGAADGSNGIIAIAANDGTRPALCLSASRTLGSDDRPEDGNVFLLQNLIVSGQHGTGDLGLVVSDEEMRLLVQPSGRNVACEFFAPTPCVSFADNVAEGAAGTGGTASVVTAIGRLDLVRASIRGNIARGSLLRNYLRSMRIESSIVAGNSVIATAASPTRAAFAVGFNALFAGQLTIRHSTVVFDTALERFFDLQHVDAQVTARAGIFASSVTPAPANVGGVASPTRLRREWCGFFQDSSDFASHTEVADPTSGMFAAPGPVAYALDPITFTPGYGLVDWCTRSTADDFHGAPFGSVGYFVSSTRADIGAVENRDDVIFADAFEA